MINTVSDRGNCLQIWMADANILNKVSRTADEGWPSSLGVGCGTNNYYRKNLRQRTGDNTKEDLEEIMRETVA